MKKICEECGKPFETIMIWAVICEACCFLPDSAICFEALSLWEGSVECHWAAKGHAQPHKWEGVIAGNHVKIEWNRLV